VQTGSKEASQNPYMGENPAQGTCKVAPMPECMEAK